MLCQIMAGNLLRRLFLGKSCDESCVAVVLTHQKETGLLLQQKLFIVLVRGTKLLQQLRKLPQRKNLKVDGNGCGSG